MNRLKKIPNTFKNASSKINALVQRKDPRIIYAILGIIIIVIIAFFTYLYFTYIWSGNIIIELQNEPVDGRKGIKYVDALKLSDTRRTYSCTFGFWINISSMSNMQETETNYILSYDMKNIEGIRKPYFNVIYGDIDDTTKNQITISFKNMNNTSEHIIVKDIELQKWLCIQIVMRDVIIDVYMNGELVQSKTLNYVPILSNNGNLTIGKENGFNGMMANLTYYNDALNEFDLNKYYNRGPHL
jgi:hypothetical protein